MRSMTLNSLVCSCIALTLSTSAVAQFNKFADVKAAHASCIKAADDKAKAITAGKKGSDLEIAQIEAQDEKQKCRRFCADGLRLANAEKIPADDRLKSCGNVAVGPLRE